jgi:formylglycine-generating enzyme required for sulfatase activity
VSLVVALAVGVRLVSPASAEARSGSGSRPLVLAVWAQVDRTEPLARASIKDTREFTEIARVAARCASVTVPVSDLPTEVEWHCSSSGGCRACSRSR